MGKKGSRHYNGARLGPRHKPPYLLKKKNKPPGGAKYYNKDII